MVVVFVIVFVDFFFFFNDTATTEIYTLSLHDALPILVELVLPRVKMISHVLVLQVPSLEKLAT